MRLGIKPRGASPGAAAACVFLTLTLLTLSAVLNGGAAYNRYRSVRAAYDQAARYNNLEDSAERFVAEAAQRLATQADSGTVGMSEALRSLQEEHPALTVTETPDDPETLAILSINFVSGDRSKRLRITLSLMRENRRLTVLEWDRE